MGMEGSGQRSWWERKMTLWTGNDLFIDLFLAETGHQEAQALFELLALLLPPSTC